MSMGPPALKRVAGGRVDDGDREQTDAENNQNDVHACLSKNALTLK